MTHEVSGDKSRENAQGLGDLGSGGVSPTGLFYNMGEGQMPDPTGSPRDPREMTPERDLCAEPCVYELVIHNTEGNRDGMSALRVSSRRLLLSRNGMWASFPEPCL